MIELRHISDQMSELHDVHKQVGFLKWLLIELKKNDLPASVKVDYLEEMDKTFDYVSPGLKRKADQVLWAAFMDEYVHFIQEKSLIGIAGSNGRTPMHFISAFDASYIASLMEQKEIMRIFYMTDQNNKTVFDDRGDFEKAILLNTLDPEYRLDFMKNNLTMVKALDTDKLIESLSSFTSMQINQLVLYKPHPDDKCLWDTYSNEEKTYILRYTVLTDGKRWRGPGSGSKSNGHERS